MKTASTKSESYQIHPFGVSRSGDTTHFSISATNRPNQTPLHLEIHPVNAPVDHQPTIHPLTPIVHLGTTIWQTSLTDLPNEFAYGYRYGDTSPLIIDPYCHHLEAPREWNKNNSTLPRKWRSVYATPPFDWQNVPKPQHKPRDLMIYEMHVRGFTSDPSSTSEHPGTFLGLIDKIPHLLDLGINAVELLPVFEFNEAEYQVPHPETGDPLCQYWGYSTLHFFTAMGRYAVGNEPWAPSVEFRTMVRELHRAGITVILDVVYNHSGENKENFPSLRSLDDKAYFIKDTEGNDTNYTGCGNTINANSPLGMSLIIDSLRYWTTHMGVDGFRFDLASALTRGSEGTPQAYSPIIEAISNDPLLANSLLIAEAWDAAGLYQVGHFGAGSNRWLEWNGRYRDDVRRFIKGTPDHAGAFATRLCGSEDLYGRDRTPYHSVNYITAHDGFSLADLVSYNHKHNIANGEENRDGSDDNDSWNCGHEGPSTDKEVQTLRNRQRRNYALALMISQGVPMLKMGDEYGHIQNGNNNVWCQDNTLNWFQWNKINSNSDLDSGFGRFLKILIKLRKNHPHMKRKRFLQDTDIIWHDKLPNRPDWDADSRIVAYTLPGDNTCSDLYIAFNAHHFATNIVLPFDADHEQWCWIVNTALPSPEDITNLDQCRPVPLSEITLQPHSAVLLRRDLKSSK
jgi:isoamylase/glycogen operon protein